jgi:hypothetical protein
MPRIDRKLVDATIGAYLASGKTLFQQGKPDAAYLRFRRALHLATKPTPALQEMLKRGFDEFLAHQAPTAPLIEVTEMLQLYRDHIDGDAAQLAGYAANYATRAKDAKKWHLRRRLLTLLTGWLKAQGRNDDAKTALYEAAETHFALAEEAINRSPPGFSLAAEQLSRAARAHRELDRNSKRASDLDQLRAEYQRQGIQQTQWVNLLDEPGSEPLRKAVEAAESALQLAAVEAAQAVQGLGFYDALRLLVVCHPPPDKAKQGQTRRGRSSLLTQVDSRQRRVMPIQTEEGERISRRNHRLLCQ